MNDKKKFLILGRNQFGYLIDVLKWCEYLAGDYDITVVGFDDGNKKITMPGVKLVTLGRWGAKPLRGMVLLLVCMYEVIRFNGNMIWVNNFPKAYLIKKILPWKKMHLDIRTLSVVEDKNMRKKEDADTEKACNLYDSLSFISEGIMNKLILRESVSKYILPLGADILSSTNKVFDELRLLYVGTLLNRNIIQTFEGVRIFVEKHPEKNIHYDIIGDSYTHTEIKGLREFVDRYNLHKVITIHGLKPYNEIAPFLDHNNIGVCYVPLTDYYDHQPPTKTFEYALSGLACIATNTYCNRQVINETNGLLIDDNSKTFAEALDTLCRTMSKYDSVQIRHSMKEYTWENIVNNKMRTILHNEGK